MLEYERASVALSFFFGRSPKYLHLHIVTVKVHVRGEK